MSDPPICNLPNSSEVLSTYCFGETTEEERYRFEEHILACRNCWMEVQRLDAVIRSIRGDPGCTRQFNSDIVSFIGISSRLWRPFGGHIVHAGVTSTIYSLMLAVTVFMEIAYQYDRFQTRVWPFAISVCIWTVVTTLAALASDCFLTRSRSRLGLLLSVVIVCAASAVHYAIIRPFFPDQAVTQAAFQTWTAQAAYLKGAVYCGGFTVLFVLVPFHFVLEMQSALQTGRHRHVWDVLTGHFAIVPRGAPYLKFWILPALLATGAVYSILSTAHLLEALKMSAYSNLFIHTIQVRWTLFLILGGECCWWYYSTLNEMKRECRVVIAP